MTQKRRNLYLLVSFPLFIIVFVTACSWSPERENGVLILRLNANPSTLDPAYIVDVTGGTLAAKMFNGLVRFGDDYTILSDIADRWEISQDRRTYIFHLKYPVAFSTAGGRPVTSEDFRYSFERVLNPATHSPVTWVLERIDGAGDYMAGRADHVRGISVPDSRTLILRLSAPFAPFLGLLAMPTAYVVPREEVGKWEFDFSSHAAGTGPFRLVQWRHGQFVRLDANPAYFGEKPKIHGILYRIIPEDLTAVAEFENGNLDAMGLPAAEYRRYTRDPKWAPLILSRTGLNTYYLGLNCSRPPLSDRRVRQAIHLAIDREKILKTIYEDRGELAHGPVPPELWLITETPGVGGNYENRSQTIIYPYNPARALELLQEAGYPDGFSMRLTITPDPEVIDIAEVIQHYLKAVRIDVEIRQLEWSAFKEATSKGETDAFYLSWWADYPDPENFLFPLFYSANRGTGGNRSRFSDPVTDRLIEEAQRTLKPIDRSALYRRVERRIVEQSPWVFLWHRKDFIIRQPWVEGLKIYPIYSMDKGLGVSLTLPSVRGKGKQ
jgi:peptide/nickel transport system substrate-binding protein/oligopeptide transport system substrate-binding protein